MFRKLLIPLDQSDLAEQALGPAAAIARASQGDVDLVLVHQPIPFGGFDDAPWNAKTIEEESKYLASVAVELTTGAGVTPTYAVLRGEAVESIAERAREKDADLIVMTTHGRTGVSRVWLGSIADGVLRSSRVPVLMLRATPGLPRHLAAAQQFRKILATLDGSVRSRQVLPAVAALAESYNARVMLLKVVPSVPNDEIAIRLLSDQARLELEDALQALTHAGVKGAEVHVVVGNSVARSILDFATRHSADVIAMTTKGRGASRMFVGSIADKVLRATTLPMLLVRPLTGGEHELLDADAVAAQLPALANV